MQDDKKFMAAWLLGVLLTAMPSVAQQEQQSTASDQAAAGLMKMTLRNQLELSGSPVKIDSIELNSLFGNAKIPLHTIAGIRFAQGANEQTTVVLLNGDALTGDVNLPELSFVSDWGEAVVNGSHLVSVVFRDDLAWSSVNTPNGRRWRLTKVQPGMNMQSNPRYIESQGRRSYAPNR